MKRGRQCFDYDQSAGSREWEMYRYKSINDKFINIIGKSNQTQSYSLHCYSAAGHESIARRKLDCPAESGIQLPRGSVTETT